MPQTVRHTTIRAAALALLVAGPAVAEPAPTPPNLVETRAWASDHSVKAGGTLVAGDTVVNRGGSRAGRSVTAYYLAGADRRIRLGGRAVRRLKPGRSSRDERSVTVPAPTAPGSYRLVACADDHNVVRESSEADNCSSADHPVKIRPPAGDHNAPSFAGLKSATTCLAGPIGAGRKSSYHLQWAAASDNVTPKDAIVYDVYRAASPAAEDFKSATYTTSPGATSFSTPELASAQTWYFVVRARDRTGNRDANRVERQGQNLCE
jgi:CARDB